MSSLFWFESFSASLSAFLVIRTVVWHDWIEGIFGFDPDQNNGSFEWELVAVVCSILARREWRRAPMASAG